MDYKVVWTDPALDHLRQIVSYIAQNNPSAAERVGNEILARVETLESQPFIGAVYRRSRHREIREILCRNIRIFYRAIEERKAVEILTLWHAARQEPDIGD